MILRCGFVSSLLLMEDEVYIVYLGLQKYGWYVQLKFILIKYMECLS